MSGATIYSPRKLFTGTVILAGAFLLGSLALYLWVPAHDPRAGWINLLSPVAYVLAALALGLAARRSAKDSAAFSPAWLAQSLGMVSCALGDWIGSVLRDAQYPLPFPSLADFFFFAFYPLFLAGLLMLPHHKQNKVEWAKTWMDMVLMMLVAGLGIWNFVLGPLPVSHETHSLLSGYLALVLPVGDLVLLWALVLILNYRADRRDLVPLFLVGLGLGLYALTDLIYGYESLQGAYQNNGLIHLGWIFASLVIALGGAWRAIFHQLPSTGEPRSLIQMVPWLKNAPAILVLFSYLLLVISYYHPLPMSFPIIAVAVGGLLLLVLIRQFLYHWEYNELFRQLQSALERLQQKTADLEQTNLDLTHEVARRQQVEEKLKYDALHDPLTNLPNRQLFIDRIEHAISYRNRNEDYRFSVLFMDLDTFKAVNDSLGHSVGDQLLVGLAHRLRANLRMSDTIARLGGDEFLILLENAGSREEVINTAARIQELIQVPFQTKGYEVFISASIGIVYDADQYSQPEDVLRDADIAMYRAKVLGKSRCQLFDKSLREEVVTRLELENDLRYALERNEFRLVYQPIFSLRANQLTGFEALIRWKHPQRGMIKPSDFITIAEETGFIVPIGRWVLLEACRQLRDWQTRFSQLSNLTMNVNISGKQLVQPDFVDMIQSVLRKTGLDGSSLKLEITETVCLNAAEPANDCFHQLEQLGIQFHIDDFGTGYSSLSYLQYLPVHTIKIDRSFINQMDSTQPGIVRTIITLAQELGMDTIAEGVETPEQLADLKQLGCDYCQGFLFYPPLPSDRAQDILLEPVPARTVAESYSLS